MKLLHTSDWHLGRGFHGADLRETQLEMMRTVCTAVTEHQVDVVLVSGDVFDRALPPEWAVRELGACLRQIREAGALVVMTSGNHDSAVRLGFNRELVAHSGVHIRSGLEDAWTPVEVTSHQERVLIYGVPYLEPQIYAAELGLDRAHHSAVMSEVVRRIRADVAARTDPEHDAAPRVIVMAHLFAHRGQASESERSIGAPAVPEATLEHHQNSVGGLAVVPLEIFEGFDYVALGHLHGRQRLADRIRYSGSPLRYSFSEEHHHKGAWLVDTQALQDPAAAVTAVDWSLGREVARLQGTLETMLAPETVQAHQEAFVQITLTDDERPARAYHRLSEAYPLLMQYRYAGRGLQQPEHSFSQRLHTAQSELEVVTGFLEHVRNRSATGEELAEVASALEAVRTTEAGEPA
ncbi:exonuclease SbcCD subunit D [Nesterenkonia sphaerica]|uniref:Nuclease SbcCD subunit D n=1 Tax=Nesterenkonia sphaerica TaxID=1804988 RepID=A0A5R9AFD8_9MICC|nr:exonuclease SbcCD subunit D [Nesterenkonia sphaerica]TLP77482.1 exonuclease SbcCD subunit D [Nesterenkonia sphaerica]